MDLAKKLAIQACGRCGQPEDVHKHKFGTDEESLTVFAALGGACTQFVVSDAAVVYQKHLAITDNRAPGRKAGGPMGKRPQLCSRCGHRGHPNEDCPF